ncbi:hypothetical protein [Bradyrhizobium lablabi]|uniref:hypothetical protein n=1 Tax=Bradyrhizobium lablabi TaxID=722472 RepID=UPI0032219679
MEQAVEWAKTREQFGRPIGEFQGRNGCSGTLSPPASRQTHALIGLSAAMSKMLPGCEIHYIPVFLAWAKIAKASYVKGGIRCSRQSNGTPDTTLANG